MRADSPARCLQAVAEVQASDVDRSVSAARNSFDHGPWPPTLGQGLSGSKPAVGGDFGTVEVTRVVAQQERDNTCDVVGLGNHA